MRGKDGGVTQDRDQVSQGVSSTQLLPGGDVGPELEGFSSVMANFICQLEWILGAALIFG